jgi:hypothetical protein
MSTKATSKFKSLEKFKFTRASTREITVQMAIDNFLEIDTMGKSFETKDWYKKRLDLFARHIGAERTITSVLEIDLLARFTLSNNLLYNFLINTFYARPYLWHISA